MADDGSAIDIKAWRQSVRDDERYAGLLKSGYPEMHDLIVGDAGDEAVQSMLRATHRAQAFSTKTEL